MRRSIAEQSTDELGGRGSVLVRQKRDHIELDAMLKQLESTSGTEQDEVLNRINRLVFSHAFAEEAVLWPVIRRALPDGEALTLTVEQEHQEVNELVTRLDSYGADDPERAPLLERLITVPREDVRDEKDVLFPRLQEVVDEQELRRLGMYCEIVRRTAPTRPHPVVARRPPGNVLAAAPLSAIDRSRDLLDSGARRTDGPLAQAMETASRGLAVAAGSIERVGAFRRGEAPSTSRG